MSFMLFTSACVIPPSLSVENQDAGVNSPPTITAIRSDQIELPEPGPVLFTAGQGMLGIDLLDTDVNDKLFVRIFRNYRLDSPQPARATCSAPATGEATRFVTCDIGTLCNATSADQDATDLDMFVVVFDREPLDSGKPPFQAMPEGGLSTSRFYYLDCM